MIANQRGLRCNWTMIPARVLWCRGRTWGRYSYRTVVGPAKAGLFKEEGKESEENEEKRVGSWQLKRIVGSGQSAGKMREREVVC